MKQKLNVGRVAVIALVAVALAGCAGYQSRKTNNTLIGAGLGGAAGAVLSHGDPLTTVGGAAAGGLLGNILTEDKRDRSHRGHRGHKRGRR
ncbi:glycine zipper 2TM domain-containing protein [Allopusillimonas ginsengisoli]|uniref:glycine zipper 2TM domain-containing protein n=1 Tax=Allopusillimonas ginsengisoli TaxID=453575 RepID=UPI00102127F4|nr:glycine zipper 2TM domain-containing protein [Allopusillimonas ginsengisoli]TEA79784.1 glycine zipper 2TM domain-containing protein [Allopusillimonas ginsengisoli]